MSPVVIYTTSHLGAIYVRRREVNKQGVALLRKAPPHAAVALNGRMRCQREFTLQPWLLNAIYSG